MARVTYGSMITELAGSIGGTTFQKNSSGNIARAKPKTIVNPSNKQSSRELMLGYLASVWSSLTLSQKQGWTDLALNNTHYDPYGKITQLNGFQQFLSNNINLSVICQNYIPDAPAYLLPTPPGSFTLHFSATQIYLEFDAPYDPSPYTFVLYFTPPLRQSNLNTRKSTFLLSGGTWTSSTVYDITAPYLAYFNIFYPQFISSVDCTIIARACVIDPVTGFRSVFSTSSAKPTNTLVFSSIWDTTLPGISANDQVVLTLDSIAAYDFIVNWGDDTSDHITLYTSPYLTHSYAAPGQYNITISGTFPGFYHGNVRDARKLIEINNWGCFKPGSNVYSMARCSNMVCTASDLLDLSACTDSSYMFYGNTLFNYDVSNCDISNITNFNYMFYGCSVFSADISGWNMLNALGCISMLENCNSWNNDLSSWSVPNLANLSNCFNGSNLSSTNYSRLLNSLAGQSTQSFVHLGAADTTYFPYAAVSRSYLINTRGWTITDSGPV